MVTTDPLLDVKVHSIEDTAGEADTVQYAPWGENVIMITKGNREKAYWQNVDYQRDYEHLLNITVADVLDTVRKIMSTESIV